MITKKQLLFGKTYSSMNATTLSEDTIVMTQQFRVASISTKANSFGLHGHIMVATTGEAWEVARSRGCHLPAWNKGQDITVPLDGLLAPEWHRLNCEIPRQLPRAPKGVVKEIYR